MADPLFGYSEAAPTPAPAPADQPAQQPGQPLEITIHPHERQTDVEQPLFGTGSSEMPARERKPLENAPEDQGNENWGKLAGTAGLTGMSTLAGGMEGDTVEAARRIAAGLVSTTGPRSTQDILDQWNTERDKANQERIEQVRTMQKPSWSKATDAQWEQQRQRKLKALELNHGAPPTTENVYKGIVEPKLGAYTPTTTPGEYGHAAIAGAVPGAIAGPLGVAAGVLGGVSSEAMNKSGANPFWSTAVPLGAGAIVPSIGKGASATRRAISGGTEAEQRATAAKLLADQASDPRKALQRAQDRANLPDETLAESTVRGNTGDQGLARTQDALLTAGQPDMVKANQRLQAERMGAVSGTLAKIAPDSQPTDVSAGFQQHLDQINATADAAPTPTAPTADVAGGNLRDVAQARRDAAMEALDKLKKSIDPDGTMGTWTGDLNEYATNKIKEAEGRPLKAEIGPVAQEYLDTAAKLKDITKFNDLVDFDQNITAGLKKTRDTDPAGYHALLELKGQVKKAMNEALENQHKWEQGKTQDGTLNPDDTLASRLQRERDEWLARKQETEGQERATGTGSADTTAKGDVPPAAGTGQEGSGAAGGPDSVPGSPALEPMSGDTANRLTLFNKGYGLAKDTFDKGDVGKALETEFGGKSKQMNAEVAQKAFAPGPKGYETAKMWLAAGGPEGLAALKDIAINRLQTELKGKPLDQKALTTWKTKHLDALRAIDEVEPGFSNQFNNAATARATVQAFEDSAAAKFLGSEPGDIVNKVSSLMKAKDSAPLRELMKKAEEIDGAPDGPIVNGLRRAGAQWLQDNFEQSGIKNIRNLIANNKDGLEALFSKEAVAQMEKVNDSIDKSATVQALANRDTPGSQTEPRAQAIEKLKAQLKATVGHDIQNGVMNTANALVIFELLSHIGHSVMAGDIHSIIGGTLGLGGTLLVKPMIERALERRGIKTQANIMRIMAQGAASREVGAALLKQVLDERGKPNQLAIDTLADALVGAETSTQREKRASGGGVFDHKAAAMRMLGMVDKARKNDAEHTKPLLKAHDDVVAHALAIANRST